MFRTWSELLPPEVEVCPVQLPGREGRLQEQPFNRMSALVENAARALLPYLDRPYAFFGHSMGALLSFELARHLRRMCVRSPSHLFVSGCRAPQLPRQSASIHDLPEDAFLEELRRLNGTPEEVLQNDELLRLLLPTLRADFAICEHYVYAQEEPLSFPLTAFGGLQDSDVPRGDLVAWHEHTRSTFNVRFFAGNHFFLRPARNSLLQALLQDISTYLN